MLDVNRKLKAVLLSSLCLIVLPACLGNDEADIQTNEPAIDGTMAKSNIQVIENDVKANSSPQISSSILSVGLREFEATHEGDFEQFACKTLVKTLTAIPKNIDVIVTPNKSDPFEVFRRDTFLQVLREQELPFIVWEDVPTEDLKKAHFSTISHPGTVISQKSVNKPSKYESEYRFFNEPMYRDGRGGGLDWVPLAHTYSDRGSHPFTPIKVHRLNDLHSFYEVGPVDENLLPNAARGDGLYYGGAFQIQGPVLTLNYPFELGHADFPIARNIVGNKLLEILRVDQFLYAISIDDQMLYETRRYVSLKITRLNIDEFSTIETFVRDSLLRPRHRYPSVNPVGSTIELCELTLKLK